MTSTKTNHIKNTTILLPLILLIITLFIAPLSSQSQNMDDGSLVASIKNESITSKTVRGIVVDEFGEPMVGVIVMTNDSTKTTTNTEGKYTIKVKLDSSLTFSFPGTKTKKEKVPSSMILNVSLLAIHSES